MEITTIFVNFRPIYILFIVIQVVSLIIQLFHKDHSSIMNVFTIGIILSASLAVSAYLTYQIGILSDALSIGGDPVSFVMFIGIAILSLLNSLVFFRKKGMSAI
ncbi:hypothetical protein ACP26L_12065 [Paenibacillus sp. S-38]|uniref:hypothetical protein n=1 Tax=Paenibacillus sp. S-38 TaxID=3416710 RepID=UPI003CF32B8F